MINDRLRLGHPAQRATAGTNAVQTQVVLHLAGKGEEFFHHAGKGSGGIRAFANVGVEVEKQEA